VNSFSCNTQIRTRSGSQDPVQILVGVPTECSQGRYCFLQTGDDLVSKSVKSFLQPHNYVRPILYHRRRQPTARVPSVARGTIFNGTLSELKYSNYDLYLKKLNL